MTDNPLLQPFAVAPYHQLGLQHLIPAIEQIIDDNRQAVQRIIASQAGRPTWDDLVMAIDALDARLDKAFAVMVALQTLGEAWIAAVDQCDDLVRDYRLETRQNATLLALYEDLANGPQGQNLSRLQKASLTAARKAFRLAGCHLNSAERAHLLDLEHQIKTLEHTYSSTLRKAREEAMLIEDASLLAGVPGPDLALMASRAEAHAQQGWRVTLEPLSCLPILRHASNRELREAVYRAFHGAAPENTAVLGELTLLRNEKARLLGFARFAELSLQSKAFESPEQVSAFIQGLIDQGRGHFLEEHLPVQASARNAGIEALQPWDIEFYTHHGQAEDTGLSEDQFKAHFALPAVLDAMRELALNVFGVQILPSQQPVWHPQVQAFEVWKDHALLGHFYMDLLAREGKPDFGWSNGHARHVSADGVFQCAAAWMYFALVAVDGAPVLLCRQDLAVLYHEFGHCLHHFLVEHGDYRLANLEALGIDRTEFDGEFVERWTWSVDYLMGIARHVETAAPLPREALAAYLDKKRHQQSNLLAWQLAQAHFDLQLHLTHDAEHDVQPLVEKTFNAVLPYALADFERPASAFDHLVNGYAAGFYCYLWSRIYAVDAFGRFEAKGVLNAQTGEDFCATMLAPGRLGNLHDHFNAFRGRPMSTQPFLTWSGLAAT